MIMSSPASAWSRRAFVRSSVVVMFAVSSMKIGALASAFIAGAGALQGLGEATDEVGWKEGRIARHGGHKRVGGFGQAAVQAGQRTSEAADLVGNDAATQSAVLYEVLVGIDQHRLHLRAEVELPEPVWLRLLWAWAVFTLLRPWLGELEMGLLISASLLVGWWACKVTAENMAIADPGAIVWDEVLAFCVEDVIFIPISPNSKNSCCALLDSYHIRQCNPSRFALLIFVFKTG